MVKFAIGFAAALLAGSAAQAIVVDGSYDAAYGAATKVIPYSAGPNGDFNNYGSASSPAYSIFLNASNGNVYGFLKADTSFGGAIVAPTFANVYFDIDPATGNGADLVFELSANAQRVSALYNAPVPVAASGISVAVSTDGTGIEFAIPNHYFTTAYSGVDYDPAQVFGTVGSPVTLRISQSFGYDVVGGASFGADRLGRVILAPAAAVPEPAMWGLMIAGFGLVGSAARRRRAVTA